MMLSRMGKTDSEEGEIERYARTPAEWGLAHRVTVLEGVGRLWEEGGERGDVTAGGEERGLW